MVKIPWSDTDFILRALNTCKAAWDIANEHRAPSRRPKMVSTHDDFNTYFVKVANDVVSNLPMVQVNTVDSLPTHPIFVLDSLRNLSNCDIITTVKKFKDLKSQDIYRNSSHLLKAVIDLIVTPLTMLVNFCFEKADSLKIVKANPIYKMGDPSLFTISNQ